MLNDRVVLLQVELALGEVEQEREFDVAQLKPLNVVRLLPNRKKIELFWGNRLCYTQHSLFITSTLAAPASPAPENICPTPLSSYPLCRACQDIERKIRIFPKLRISLVSVLFQFWYGPQLLVRVHLPGLLVVLVGGLN